MTEFRQVTQDFWASPQIGLADVEDAGRRGFALIINNRPEGESPDQPEGDSIERAAAAAGLDYRAIPVTPGAFGEAEVEAMADALGAARGPVLAYCRSGTRSTLLWALAQATRGRSPDSIAADAARAGYDVGPIRPLIDRLARPPERT